MKHIVEPVVVEAGHFNISDEAAIERLHLRPGRKETADALALLAEARELARPRGVYKLAFIEERGPDYAVVDGIKLTSRVLAVNTAGTHRVFAFVATAGPEMEAWMSQPREMFSRYLADQIAELAVRQAAECLSREVAARFEIATIAAMDPGSLADWPISEQRPLFAILGDVEGLVGVRLLDSFLMVPRKSVSGIYFASEEGYANCQLCPRTVCPNRRARYDAELFAQKYAPAGA